MRLVRFALLVFLIGGIASVRAQSLVPVSTQAIPAQTFSASATAVKLDLRSYFGLSGLIGTQIVQFDTVFGRFNVELRDDVAPHHVANFLAYVSSGAYANSFIHRSSSFDNGAVSIVQGGGYGYKLPFSVYQIDKLAPVALEYNLPNARGTLAAARTSDVNSATSEWYFNTRDNSTILNQSNGGGYTVFGRVLGNGMSVVDQMAAVPRFNAGGAFAEVPLRNYTSGNPSETNLVTINSVKTVPIFPAGGDSSVLTFAVDNPGAAIVGAELLGSTLKLTPLGAGTTNVTIRVTDTNGSTAQSTFAVTVAGGTPAFAAQPASQTVAAGSTVVFNAPAARAARYRWERNGQTFADATASTLVIYNASADNAGSYVAFATNSSGTVQSTPATLTVANLTPVQTGRLINLSILTTAGAGARVLTMGAVVGPANASGALPMVVRAVGPTLGRAPFNISGVLPDPVMTLYASGNATPIDSNDNWGGDATLSAAFRSVGAFDLPADSLDSALVRTSPGAAPGGYTVQVSGKGDASGLVIAEIYDASAATRTATTPRLINLSTRAQIDAGTDLAVGFVIGGQSSRTMLVRGIGPSLSPFGVTGVMSDPQLELFNNAGQRIMGNDDWGASAELSGAATRVGAFPLAGGNTLDAAILVTLPPGAYSARISGVSSTGGTALVEVYEVP